MKKEKESKPLLGKEEITYQSIIHTLDNESTTNEERENKNKQLLINSSNTTDQSIIIMPYSKPVEKKKPPSILIRTTSFGLSGLIIASHLVGNGKVMTLLGPNEAAAASVITTMQSVTIGTSFGLLLSTGMQLGAALGSEDHKAAEAAIKISWLSATILGFLSSTAFLSTRLTMPLLLEEATANAVAEFFKTFAIAPIADLMIMTNGLIIFQVEKNWQIPLISTALYRLPAVPLGYYLANECGYGPMGIGLGSSAAAVFSFALLQSWFLRNAYKDYKLHKLWQIPEFKKHLKKFLTDGWKLSLQRITEWGNLVGITMIVGHWSNTALKAEQPSIQALTLFNLFSQGVAQAAMMITTRDRTEMNTHLKKFYSTNDQSHLNKYLEFYKKNKSTFFISNGAGFVLNTAFAAGLYFARHPIVDLFVPSNSTQITDELAYSLLELNALSLLFDAIRIISGGVLRGWGDLLYPTLASLIIMSLIGIPMGAGIGYHFDENILPLFILRVITIALSATVNCYRFYRHTKDDMDEYELAIMYGDLLKSLFEWEKTINTYTIKIDNQLITKAEEFGLLVESTTDEKVNFFTVISDQLITLSRQKNLSEDPELKLLKLNNESETTELKVRRSTIQHIQKNPLYYQGKNKNLVDVIMNTDTPPDTKIVSAIARTFNANIVILRNDTGTPDIIHRANLDKTVYIAYDVSNHHYYSLTGEANKILQQLIDQTPMDEFKISKTKSIFTNITTHFNSANKSKLKKPDDNVLIIPDSDSLRLSKTK